MTIECIAFSEGQNAKKYITIEEKLKPLLMSMKLFGMYFDPKQVSRIIKDQFLVFRQVISKKIQEADDHIPERLPELRSRYTQLCQAVDSINRTFKWILGISFFLQVFMACFISYQMINRPQEMFTFFANSFWLGGCFLTIILLTRSSSGVHEAAHSLLEDIFHTGTKNATTELLGQLSLFVFKLTGTSIGFTVINFFVITNEFLLTLIGLFITYFFLLLQFKL
ncbi:gustatory receptor family protein 3-like [Haliotis rubra]|uniref:gustatory receptor family protein 3-like n=1 Tax=Haliotis rubra TaxID=36100 RepID=UPI001EE5075A|nr:gustatory receptor family protein 3-like [Haliotis rubra]